jgi:hypothetical protein
MQYQPYFLQYSKGPTSVYVLCRTVLYSYHVHYTMYKYADNQPSGDETWAICGCSVGSETVIGFGALRVYVAIYAKT